MRWPLSVGTIVRLVGVAAALAAPATPLQAQSLFANRGLGLLLEPQDGRAHALGGATLGLPNAEISWNNPAGAVGLPAPGLLVSFQFDDFDASFSGRTATGSTARFPLILGAFPFGEKWAVTVGFGGFLDQTWAVEQADTLLVGTDSVPVLDRVSSEGGVSRFRLGGGYRLLPQLSIGAGIDLFTGGVQRVSGRLFPGEAVPRCCSAEWRYSGVGVLTSVDFTPTEALTVALSASKGGTLKADVQSGTGAQDSEYELPLMLHAGTSARVAPELLVVAGAEWAGWSTVDEAVAEVGGARDSWAARGGIEWDALNIGQRVIPFRLGAHTRNLPFRWGTASNEWATERGITAGTGLVLGGGAARADFSVERGQRGGESAGLSEKYWRIVFGATVLGQ